MKHKILFIILFILVALSARSQTRVGINTSTPDRQLHIYGNVLEYLRIRSTLGFGSQVGMELVRGNNMTGRDWKIENSGSVLKFLTTTNNFSAAPEEVMRFTDDGYAGIGTTAPVTRLHIDDGVDASNASDGYMVIGTKNGYNMVFDDEKIIARNNGAPATLHIQTGGGNTYFGSGNIYAADEGHVSQGDAPMNAKFNVEGSGFQVYLRNDADIDVNDWYIGASGSTWQTGDDYLLFSPTSAHLDAVLRLNDVSDNDGFEAPVMISSSPSQTLLMDGNEIDSYTPLHINHNSNENTYINPSGGNVGIGLTNPDGRLHVNTDEVALTLQDGFNSWWIQPVQNGNLNFFKNTVLLATVSWNGGGEYVPLSDQRFKRNIKPLGQVMEKVKQLGLHTYGFSHHQTDERDMGVIAQEALTIFPEVVHQKDDFYGVSYDQLTVVAIKGIQEQQEQLEALEKQIDALLAKK